MGRCARCARGSTRRRPPCLPWSGTRGTSGRGRPAGNCSGLPRRSRSRARGRREATVRRRLYSGSGLVGPGPESWAEITRAPREPGGHANRAGVRVHIATLPAAHMVSYRGVPLTSVPRTVIDLARTLPFAEGVAVADSALHAGLTSKGALGRRHRGLPAMAGPAAGPPGNRVQRCPFGVGAGVPQPGRLFTRWACRLPTCRSGLAMMTMSSAGWTSCGAGTARSARPTGR